MTLQGISVKKFMQLHAIITGNQYAEKIDEEIALIACLNDTSVEAIEQMKLPAFRKEREKLSVLTLDNIAPKAAKYITANGKTYAPVYIFDKLTAGQLTDVMHFLKNPADIIANLPQILACFCLPTRRGLFHIKPMLLPYLSTPHDEVSRDLAEASIVDAYGIALFFCAASKRFFQNTNGYLIKKIAAMRKAKGEELTTEEAKALLTILEWCGDGITPPNKLP